jgi:hypothetical protein
MRDLITAITMATSLLAWAEVSFEKEIRPLLEDYCFDCHADGSSKGDFSMDHYQDLSAHLQDVDHWLAVWRNVRAQIMPPPKKDQLQSDEVRQLLSWIETQVFRLDPNNPDPGRVTIRRLNRMEYHYTISDLLGVDYQTWDKFPADDTGYGFDTIGDVLSISPLHMEKYVEAAAEIVNLALPQDAATRIPIRIVQGSLFRSPDKTIASSSDLLPLKAAQGVLANVNAPARGSYEIHLDYAVKGASEASDQSAYLEVSIRGKKVAERAIGWDQRQRIRLSGQSVLLKGENQIEVKIIPKDPPAEGQSEQYVELQQVELKGPMDGSYQEYPKGYRMIMVDGPAPEDMRAREIYAAKIMKSFVSRAYRRPLDQGTISRLVQMVMEEDRSPGKTFEDGIKLAMTAVLASPRFLFRAEIQPEPNNKGTTVLLDEFALASRLSFFLWSSVPDDELLSLAYQKKLRENLRAQIDRMLADPKSQRFVKSFVGQWLQARDVETKAIDARKIAGLNDQGQADRLMNNQVRRDMRLETEKFFEFILKNDRPAEELISARYSFLNERLGEFYGIKGVQGDDHRLVDLHEHPERGGLLTQGTFLIVTSNPTRTSPVKRGLFVLDNLLGTPAPPAPPGIPELEEVAHQQGKPLTIREMMVIHRQKPLCASCHQRMDPIGLGLENFNAIGQYRTTDQGEPIDTGGQLISGERFTDVATLKTILANERRDDFYRCLSEKLLTYATGRGTEYFDAVTIHQLVERLKANGGLLKESVVGVIESAPFQKRRGG